MQDLNKKDEENKIENNNEESKVEVKEEKSSVVKEIKDEIKAETDTVKVKIGTVGNAVLFAFFVLIVATGILAYYLIHDTKDNIDQQYSDLIQNLSEYENLIDDDEEGTTVANIIDGAMVDAGLTSTNSVTTEVTDDRKIMNEELVVLYKGLILDTSKMDEVKLKYIDNKIDGSDKYVITYYSYEHYAFKESKLGTFSTQLYDGLVKIDGVGKVAISENYEAIPREVKVINTVPSVITNTGFTNYDTVKTIITDLDGNGVEEYIVIFANKQTGYSKISFYDSKGSFVDDLASIEKSKWRKGSNAEYYLSLDNVDILDIDNDGIMEVLVEIPHATGDSTVSILKYNNGKLTGKTGIECSLLD